MSNPATPNLHEPSAPNSPPAKGEYPEGGRGFLPKLRFPEFRDADWRHDHVGNLTSITKGKGISKADVEAGGSIPCIRYAELYTHYDEVIHEIVSRTNLPKEDLVLSQAGDVIIPASGETKADIAKAACVLAEGVALGSDLNVLRSELYGPFLSYLLNSPLRHHIARVAQGDTVAHLYPKQISQVRLAYPARLEQQKIADCLNSLDDLIAAENQKLEALRQHKQGLMQQLFRQLGETVPRLRFPEFIEAPRWQISTFGERCESFSGSTPDTSNKTYYGGTIPFIRSAEIGSDKTEIFLTKEGLKNSAAKMVRRGDLLVALYGANSGDTALARVDGAINQAIMCLRSNDSVQFLYHYLIARKNWIITTYLQGGQGNLSGQIVLSVKLSIPDKDEQQKIAACLNSLDDVIAAKNRKLETLRYHKQGLMQQLFPSLESY